MMTESSKLPSRTRQLHGFTKALKARYRGNVPQLDGRCSAAQAMAGYRAELLSSLGGTGNVSAQELSLIDLCAKDWMILQAIDGYLFEAGFYNKRKRTAYPLTIQRQTIADGLTRRLLALGLKKRARPVQTLSELLNSKPEPAQAVDAGT